MRRRVGEVVAEAGLSPCLEVASGEEGMSEMSSLGSAIMQMRDELSVGCWRQDGQGHSRIHR